VKDLEARKAAFMGKITAGVTHELKNVLAIIKESAGLMEDLIALHKGPPMPNQEKFSRGCDRIRQQVERGVDLATKLNAFAHSPDDLVGEVDLNAVVEQAAFLTARFARLKGIGLAFKPYAGPLRVITDPLKIQMLLFNGLDLLLGAVQSGSEIALIPAQDSDGGVSLIFSVGGPAQGTGPTDLTAAPQWSDLQSQAAELSATLVLKQAPECFAIQFTSRR
jgi:C4-dicarboxylate-specific signal transduction histidine kinase